MSLADDLKATADALASGWTIDNLNRARARRAQERTMPRDTTDAILDRLNSAHGVVSGYSFTYGDGGDFDDALDVLDSIKECGIASASDVVDVLAGLATLLDDASNEIVRLTVKVAGLRAREAKP